MIAPGSIAWLHRGLRSAREGRNRRLVAATLLFTALVLYLLLVLFPGIPLSGDPRELFRELCRHPGLLEIWLAAAATLVWAIWTLVGGAVLRATALHLVDRPAEDCLPFCRGRWASLFGAPFASLLPAGLLLALAAGILQVVRIPWAGWILLVPLAPVVLTLAGGGAAILLRWFLVGHLVLPGVAFEGSSAYVATVRSSAWLRRSPYRIVLLRLAGAGLAIWETLLGLAAPAAALAALGWVLSRLPGDPGRVVLDVLREGLGSAGAAEAVAAGAALALGLILAAWYLSLLVCHRIGARAALYLLHRRDLDGVAPEDPGPEPGPGESLAELGATLVQRIRDEEEE